MARASIVISGTVGTAVQNADFLNMTVNVTSKVKGQDVVTPFSVSLYNKENKHQYTVNNPVLVIGELIYNEKSQYKKLIVANPFVSKGSGFNFSKLTIVGTATRDAEIRTLQTGVMVADTSIAVNSWLKSEGGETTTFAKVTVWGKKGYDVQAERFGKNCLKGDQVILTQASVLLDKYTNRDGIEVESLAISAFDSELIFTSPAHAGRSEAATQAAPTTEPAPTEQAPVVQETAPTTAPAEVDINEDEIPF